MTKPIVLDELLARIRVHLANARLAHSARAALDASGRYLLATNTSGRVLWCTPQTAKLLGLAFVDFHGEGYLLPSNVQEWLQNRSRSDPKSPPDLVAFEYGAGAIKLQLSYVGQVGPNEILLRLLEGEFKNDNLVLKRQAAADTARIRGPDVDRAGQIQPRHRRNPEPQSAYGEQAPGTDLRQARGGEPRVGGGSRGTDAGALIECGVQQSLQGKRHPIISEYLLLMWWTGAPGDRQKVDVEVRHGEADPHEKARKNFTDPDSRIRPGHCSSRGADCRGARCYAERGRLRAADPDDRCNEIISAASPSGYRRTPATARAPRALAPPVGGKGIRSGIL